MKKEQIFYIAIASAKVYCIFSIISSNIINMLYCLYWKPGNEQIKAFLAGGRTHINTFSGIINTCNHYAHKNSLYLFIVLLLMILIRDKFKWLIFFGLLTIAGLFIQLSYFDILY